MKTFLLLILLALCSCAEVEMAEPFPVEHIRFEQNGGILFHLYRDRPIDVWYHNPFDDSVNLLDRWCLDSTGRDHCVVGIGELCVELNCITLE